MDDENDADRANDQDEESYSEDSELEDNPNHRPRFFCSDEDDEEDDDEEEDDEEDEDESIKNMPKNDDQESVEKETSAVHVTQKMAEK